MTTTGRVLLADDSPHAQRMGERILREEGYEVVTVTDGETAIMRLKDVDPDVVIVDAFLPQVSGYDLCGFIKKQPQHSHVQVLLTSTALEKVDEDHAYKVGADGQLKKPFEASVMLKSLKDLIGGSEKKKRAGTTLDLNSPAEEAPEKSENRASGAEADTGAEEKPVVSALQAWLQQHDAAAFSAEDQPSEDESAALDEPDLVSAPVAGRAAAASVDAPELANPQLLRRAEEEPEDLSLRNNPVARLRYSPKQEPQQVASPSNRLRGTQGSDPAGPTVDTDEASFKMGSRNSRVQSISQPPSGDSDPEEASRTPRKSLLQQLEEFEKASEVAEEQESVPPAPATKSPFGRVKFEEEAPDLASASLEEAVEDLRRSHAVPERKPEAPQQADTAESEAEAADEEMILPLSRRARNARPSILETVRELGREEEKPEESEEAEELASAPEPEEEPAVIEPAPEDPALAAAALDSIPAALAVAEKEAVLSLAQVGVRLDEEEMRAVVEIAVSAAMPAIVGEVSRCVLLALESRYAQKALRNGDHSND